MIERLKQTLHSPRRHLALLATLLVITFVLTGVLTQRAHRIDQERRVAIEGTLRSAAQAHVKRWEEVGRNMIKNSIPTKPAAMLVRDANVSLDEIIAETDFRSFCESCPQSVRTRGFFSLDVAAQSIEWRGADTIPNVVHSIADELIAAMGTRYGPHFGRNREVGFGLFLRSDAGEIVTVLAYMRHADDLSLQRVVGAVLERDVAPGLLRITMEQLAEEDEPSDPLQLNQDSLFAIRFLVDRSVLLAEGGEPALIADLVSGFPVSGVTLHIGVREPVLASSSAARMNLLMLLALAVLISVLLGVAMALVRKEAELVRLRADFVSSVTHELRTPLAQIRMFTETLLLGRVRSDMERRRSLEIVDQEARRLTHLVESLLAFSKNEGGHSQKVLPTPMHMASEIRQAVDSFIPLCRTAGAEIRVELQENVDAVADKGALRQIMLNLLDNALKYGPAGQRITVGLALFDDRARLWVDDEGAGIPPDERERVFDSFYRMKRDVASRVVGSGIGLAVVRQLARSHGGDAWAQAAPGSGARIVVEFPGAYLQDEQKANLAAAS